MTQQQLARLLSSDSRGPGSALDVLDDRELEIFSILSQGYSAGQIELELGMAASEVGALKRRVQKKLGLKSELQLLQAAARYSRQGSGGHDGAHSQRK